MKWSRNLLLSCEILTARKLRTFLSIFGIVVGIATVILLVSAGKGAEKQVLDRVRSMGINLIIVNAGKTQLIAGRQRQMTSVTTLVLEDASAILKESSSVTKISPAVNKKLSIKWESEIANTNLLGFTPVGFEIRNLKPALGRFFEEEENRKKHRVAVLGPTVAKNLFGRGNPIGLQIRLGKIPFEVIGVTRKKGMDVNGIDQDDVVFVPLNTAMRRIMNMDYVHSLYIQGKNSKILINAEKEIRSVLRQRHRLASKSDDFTIQNQIKLLETEQETSQSMTLLIGSVSGISLFVGGVGILAVMLISVKERTKEIGLRRAIGALRSDIRNQFLLESGILAGAGGVIGAGIGLSLSLLISFFGFLEMVISWPAVCISCGFSVGVGVVFGFYPAVLAAQLEPIQALRS
jgi:putative ABC transport system permease protein